MCGQRFAWLGLLWAWRVGRFDTGVGFCKGMVEEVDLYMGWHRMVIL
jgi:hypothetical protein